ncbi:MAG: FAD-binding oxidoreductase [Steroidobacteraceae bacterium]
MSASQSGSGQSALAGLRQQLPGDVLITDQREREFFSQDVYRRGELPMAVLRPGSAEQLATALRALADSDVELVPRGGGMSYTDGYLPRSSNSVVIDLQRLDRVVEINLQDRYVTIECGATWKALNDALLPHGLRTPYWGPLSGLRSSIGGALSQGSIFLGAGTHGSVADSVIGLDVMLADGRQLRLGSHSIKNGAPFFRNFGPDLLGMFLSDTGALGIKTRATFKLLPVAPCVDHLSFSFAAPAELFAAMAELARKRVGSEIFAFDPGLQAQRMKRASLADDVKTLGKVVRAAGGAMKGLKAGAKLMLAGREFLPEEQFSLHLTVEGASKTVLAEAVALAREICGGAGSEVEASVPRVMRANPFAEVNSMLGPNGERWVPVHGIVPLSRGAWIFEQCEGVFARHAEAMNTFDIDHGYLSCTVGSSGLLLEPVMYWPAERLAFHERVLDADYLARLPSYPPNPQATAAVHALRADLATLFMEAGAVSFQIGKFYPYQQGLDPSARALLGELKQLLDPNGRMNPGSLGL